jgi:hypothetical protein
MTVANTNTETVISNLVDLLNKGNAHVPFDEALKNIPFDLLGEKPAGLPYSIWQITEHIRIAQWDIVEFSKNARHVSPKWPDAYWPSSVKPASQKEWKNCLEEIKKDRYSFVEFIEKAGEDIYKPFTHGNGQTLLSEALVLADHNSYHTAEIIILRRLLQDWKK